MTRPDKLTLAVAIVFGRRRTKLGNETFEIQTLFKHLKQGKPALWVTGVRHNETPHLAVARCLNTRFIAKLRGHSGVPNTFQTSDFTPLCQLDMGRYVLEVFNLSWAMPQEVEKYAPNVHVAPLGTHWEEIIELDKVSHEAFWNMPPDPIKLATMLMPYPRGIKTVATLM